MALFIFKMYNIDMNIKYVNYEEKYRASLCYMINQLYIEDPEGQPMSQSKIDATIKQASECPDRLKIIMITDDESVIGYAIIQLAWSNEWGGLIANIDEMYIMQKARSQGIASKFIEGLTDLIPDITRVTLEVTPSNDRAIKLYKRLGFSIAENSIMEKTWNI